MSKTLIIIGASRGIGLAVAKYYEEQNYETITVSRSKSNIGEWIQADISMKQGIFKVLDVISDRSLDALLFMGGVWEKDAFSKNYNFETSSFSETQLVINVNLVAPIELTKGLAANFKKSKNPRAIYMGALSGLDLSKSHEVAYSASKFGLRGAISALRRSLKAEGIGFTVINPGYVATEEVLRDIESGESPEQTPIPMEDIVQAVDYVLNVSKYTDIGDLTLMQKYDTI